MPVLARYLMIAGVVLFLIGAGLYALTRMGIPIGRLPGDIRIENENYTIVLPLASTIVLSILLTVLLNVIVRFFNR